MVTDGIKDKKGFHCWRKVDFKLYGRLPGTMSSIGVLISVLTVVKMTTDRCYLTGKLHQCIVMKYIVKAKLLNARSADHNNRYNTKTIKTQIPVESKKIDIGENFV
mmetsp:Transcript_91577/g.179383  ORF Transcript_91577/g.179383 Transcript_91577/m.179383 type:complete len:106 (-) Transcript_91577:292-609(-)